MSTVTARKSAKSSKSTKAARAVKSAAKSAAPVVTYEDETRRLTAAQAIWGRDVVKQWQDARGKVECVFGEGSSDTPADFEPCEISNESYAWTQMNEHNPNTAGRFHWGRLAHAERDLVHFIEAMAANGINPWTEFGGAALVLGGYRFMVVYSEGESRLDVEAAGTSPKPH